MKNGVFAEFTYAAGHLNILKADHGVAVQETATIRETRKARRYTPKNVLRLPDLDL
jgi:hypothetical protein